MTIEITGDEPRWAGVPVGTIVHACHEKTIDDGLKTLGLPGLDRDSLDPLLTYCAELRCEADQGHVSGLQEAHARPRASPASTTSSPGTRRSSSATAEWF